MIQMDNVGRIASRITQRLFSGASRKLDVVLHTGVDVHDRPGQRVVVLLQHSSVVRHHHVLLAQLVVAIRQTSGGHRIGDQHTVRPVGLPRETNSERVRVDAIDDDGVVGRVFGGHSQHADHARVAVMEGSHRVEQVRHQRRSCGHSIDRLVDVGGSVTHRHGDVLVAQVADGVQSALQLRCQRHHLHVGDVAVALHHGLHALRGLADVLGRMCSGTLRRDEGTFAMSTEDGTAVLHRTLAVGKQLQVSMVGLEGGRDDRRTDGSASGGQQVSANVVDLFWCDLGVAKVVPKRSIDLDINEPWAHDAVFRIDHFISIDLI